MTRATWAIVGGVLVLVALALALALLARGREPPPDLARPEGVALAYALDIQQHEPDKAWDLLSESARAQTTRERFMLRAESFARSYERARLSVEDPRTEGESARLELVRTLPSSGGLFGFGGGSNAIRANVRLVREGGQWRISTPPEPFLLERLP
ncbi:MAG: hypothetical protein M3336_11245 [Chloroflexota bacterium]|nr:hypothetical protein [Chloroflexota bacterium]